MAKKRIEDKPPGQGWLVTFSDCMTLLLCFFVLLLSFSSFDPQSLSRLEGVMDVRHFQAMSNERDRVEDLEVPPPDNVVDQTREGSDRIMDIDPKVIHYPKKRPTILDSDVYSARKTFYISSKHLFTGNQTDLSAGGRRQLKKIAELLELVPSHVIICESSSSHPQAGTDMNLMRSMAIMEYLVDRSGLSGEHFGVSGTDPGVAGRFGGSSVIQITLRSRGLLK